MKKTNPNKPKVKIGKMNVTSFITMSYEQITMNNANKNKPKQTQPVVSLPALLVLRSIGEGGSIVEVSNLFQTGLSPDSL